MIVRILAWPLGSIMRFFYQLTADYGITILLFAVAIKLIMLPLSVLQQKNSIKMVRIQPKLNELSVRYANDQKKLVDEQFALYKREKYRPLLGLVPTLIQVPIIIGLINVVYHPFKWLLGIGDAAAEAVAGAARILFGAEAMGSTGQLLIAGAMGDAQTAERFFSAASGDPAMQDALERIGTLNPTFLGWNLFDTPAPGAGVWLFAVPVLAVGSTLLLCVLQNSFNVLSKEQGKFSKWGMTAFLTLFILAFVFLVPAAVSLYWAAGNLASAAILFALNLLIPPGKYIDYEALEKSKTALARSRAAQKAAQPTKEQKRRAKADYKRFFHAENGKKEIVFYSEISSCYRFYKALIREILDRSDIVIHYVTCDPNDIIFTLGHERLIPYYIDRKDIIILFMKLDCTMMITTVPDLQTYQLKRSLVNKKIDYLYLFHGMTSTTMAARKGAFDAYDTLFCAGPHQEREVRETEQRYGLAPKKLIRVGYPVLDEMLEEYHNAGTEGRAYQIIIAPSHQPDNLMDSCIDDLLESLLPTGFRVVLRPHPYWLRHNPDALEQLVQTYSQYGNFVVDTAFDGALQIFSSDCLITDWSTVAFDFAFTTLKPCIFINTEMKVLNPEYAEYRNRPLDITLRSEIGVSLDKSEIRERLLDTVREVRQKQPHYREQIASVRQATIFHIGESKDVGARYIIDEIMAARTE